MRALAWTAPVLLIGALFLTTLTGCAAVSGGAEETEAAGAAAATSAGRPAFLTSELELPELRTVGDAPPDATCVTVVVGRSGLLSVDGDPALVADVRAALEGAVSSRGAASTQVLLAVDRTVPWGAVARLVIECAVAGVDQLYFAAEPADGGEWGAIAIFLPSDAGRLPGDHPEVSVFVRDGWPPSDVLGLHDVLRARASSGALSVTLDALPATPIDVVLQIADVAALEGAARFEFAAIGVPALPPGDLLEDIARLRVDPPARRLVVFDEDLSGPSLLIPHAERVRGRPAGFWQ